MSFKKILLELSWRIDTGIPDLTNPEHLKELKTVLIVNGWTTESVTNFIQNINEVEKYQARSVETGRIVDYGSKESMDQAIEDGKSEPLESGDSVGDVVSSSKIQFDNPEPGSDNALDKKSSNSTENPEISGLSKDIKTVEAQLNMTKEGAKAQAKDNTKKDVGAGTAESRAGEAMVHTGLRLLSDGHSLDEIEQIFAKISNNKSSVLNSKSGKAWVKSAIASLKMIDSEYGIDNISKVSWDTSSGRKALGIDESLSTSADMFIQTTDGKNVGISLKKDGVVFLSNGGWSKQAQALIDNLKEHISEEDLDILTKAMAIETYDQDVVSRIRLAMSSISSEELTSMISGLADHPDFSKYFGGKGGPGYLEILEDVETLRTQIKDGNLPKVSIKAFSKLLQIYKHDQYHEIRKADHELTARTFKALNDSPPAAAAMKKHIVKSMHIMDTLGLNETLKDGGLSGFSTVYGIEPDGAVLNEDSLVSLFGEGFKVKLDQVRNGTIGRNDLETYIADQITIDYNTGEIIFTHENGRQQPIFNLKGRAKSMGAAPTMEMLQTTYMTYALKNGTFDVDQWDEKTIKAYNRTMKKKD